MSGTVSDPIPKLPPEFAAFQAVLNRLLAKKPDDRFVSAEGFLDALNKVELGDASPSQVVADAYVNDDPTVPVDVLKKSPEIEVSDDMPEATPDGEKEGKEPDRRWPERLNWKIAVPVVFLILLLGLVTWFYQVSDTPAPGTVFTDTLKDGSKGPEMVIIPAGEFMMGSLANEEGRDDDERQHSVQIEKPFAISKYEVTFAEYDRFVEATGQEKPDDRGRGRGNRPVINVSWNDAAAYAEWLSQETGETYRLPTEAEWEYAARARTETAYPWGNEIGRNNANCNGCGSQWDNKQTAPVGSFEANDFALHDMTGNVREWTCSEYKKNYDGAEQRCIGNKSADAARALRGGSWFNFPRRVRSADRDGWVPASRNGFVGFRLASPTA